MKFYRLALRSLFCIPFFMSTLFLNAQETPHLRIGGYVGVLQQHDLRELDATISFAQTIEAMLKDSEVGADVLISDTFEQARKQFLAGKLDAMFCNTLDLPSIVELINRDAIYTMSRSGEVTLSYVMLTNNMSGRNKSLRQLNNKQLTIGVGPNLAAHILDAEVNASPQKNGNIRFKSVHRVRNSETAIVDLMFGKTDAALVPRIAFELAMDANPQTKRLLHTVFESAPMVPGILVMHKDVQADLLAKMHEKFIHMDTYLPGQKVLSLFHADKMLRISPSMLGGFEKTIASR